MAVQRYSVHAYFNTGFDMGNIPYSADVIFKNYTPRVFDDCPLLQNKMLGSLKISTTWDNIDGVDYIRLVKDLGEGTVDVWYYVVDVTMINENMAQLTMIMDALTTIGLNKINIIGGWTKRKHVNNDAIFANMIPEPFQPQHSLLIDGALEIDLKDTVEERKFNTIIASTVDLNAFNAKAQAFEYENAQVVVPKIPKPFTSGTEVIIQNALHGMASFYESAELPNTGLYSYSPFTEAQLSETLSALRSLGLEGIISASYQLPSSIAKITTSIEKPGYIPDLKSTVKQVPPEGDSSNYYPFKYDIGTTVFNNKVYMGVFNRYTCVNMCSGESAEYMAEDIYTGGDLSPKFIYWGDPAPAGRPYCRPKSLRGNTANIFLGCVAGELWQNSPIVFTGMSGSALAGNTLNYDRRMTERNLNIMAENFETSTVNSAIGSIGGLIGSLFGGKSASGALSNAQGAGGTIYNMNRSADMLEMAQSQVVDRYNASFNQTMATINLRVPEISFPRSQSLQNYLGNSFYVYRTRLNSNDAKRFDIFLNMYGYAVDEPLIPSVDFNCRQNFNYIMVRDCNVGGNQAMYIRQRAKQQLEQGIRIWHTRPSIKLLYSENPIV